MAAARSLTDNEIRAARLFFGSHLDYAAIRIRCGFPLLPDLSAAVSPDGRIYFPRRHYLPDYTQAGGGYLLWLIHELTHVWQWQHGFHTWLGGLILSAQGGYSRRRAYRCPPPERIATFASLNMDQQAETAARCFALLAGTARYSPQEESGSRRLATEFAAQSDAFRPLPHYFCRIGKIK